MWGAVSSAPLSRVFALQVLWAHIWGVGFLGESENWSGITGSLLLAGGVVTVSSSKSKAAGPGPDDTTAFVTSVESKAPDFEDTRITLGDGLPSQDEWQDIPSELPDKQEVELMQDPQKATRA